MDNKSSETKSVKLMILSGAGWILVLLLAMLYGLKFDLGDAFSRRAKKSDILSRMKINMLKSVESEKSAVMAVTDQESEYFADQSVKSADNAEKYLRELDSLTQTHGTEEERKLVREFLECWKNLREIDKALLDFAVQNTNLKAIGLSYTKAAESVRRFEISLTGLGEIYSSDIRITKLISQAITSVLKIHNLQAPHINAVSDEQMNDIESIMIAEADSVRASLNALSEISDAQPKRLSDGASAAFTEFMTVNAEVVKLSRQNSNIRSLELSLGKKRKIAAQCEEILDTIQEIVRSRTFKYPK